MYSSKRLMFGLLGLTALLTGCNEEEDTTARIVPPTPPFVTAGISAIAQYGATTNAQQDPGLQGAGQALNEQLGEITSKILEEQVDLAPIITVAAGERVGIQFLRDIYIRPPEPQSGQASKGDQQ